MGFNACEIALNHARMSTFLLEFRFIQQRRLAASFITWNKEAFYLGLTQKARKCNKM